MATTPTSPSAFRLTVIGGTGSTPPPAKPARKEDAKAAQPEEKPEVPERVLKKGFKLIAQGSGERYETFRDFADDRDKALVAALAQLRPLVGRGKNVRDDVRALERTLVSAITSGDPLARVLYGDLEYSLAVGEGVYPLNQAFSDTLEPLRARVLERMHAQEKAALQLGEQQKDLFEVIQLIPEQALARLEHDEPIASNLVASTSGFEFSKPSGDSEPLTTPAQLGPLKDDRATHEALQHVVELVGEHVELGPPRAERTGQAPASPRAATDEEVVSKAVQDHAWTTLGLYKETGALFELARGMDPSLMVTVGSYESKRGGGHVVFSSEGLALLWNGKNATPWYVPDLADRRIGDGREVLNGVEDLMRQRLLHDVPADADPEKVERWDQVFRYALDHKPLPRWDALRPQEVAGALERANGELHEYALLASTLTDIPERLPRQVLEGDLAKLDSWECRDLGEEVSGSMYCRRPKRHPRQTLRDASQSAG
jgi:hypothetical protein